MKYRLKIGEETADTDAAQLETEQGAKFTIGEKQYDVRYKAVSDHCFHLVVNGKATQAFVARGEQGKYISVNGRCFLVQDVDRLPLRRARRRGPEETPREVTPPMPALVVRILVEEGDRVKRGQGLIVVSAMKMETTLVAPLDGRVIKINTSLDEKVSPGDILVEIEEEVTENE